MGDQLPSQYDKRAWESAALEIREDDGATVLRGLVVPFGKRSENLGGFTEEFQDITPRKNVLVLWSHDTREVLGSVAAGNVKLEKRSGGLYLELRDPAMSEIQLDRIKRGILPGASFGFEKAQADVIRENANGTVHRVVKNADLLEVSVGVAFPAYRQTDITAAKRSLDAARESDESAEAIEAEHRDLRLRLAAAKEGDFLDLEEGGENDG